MNKTREDIQKKCLELLKENNYNGTLVLDTGTGKSYIAIQAIKEGKFKNILIISPRDNLKLNWINELEKWGIYLSNPIIEEKIECYYGNNYERFEIHNVQSAYKFSKQHIEIFDIILADECHKIFTPEYSSIIVTARKLNIPVIALTATPDKDEKFRKEFYPEYCPILLEYHDAEEDNVVNKVKYTIFEYNLTNDYKVKVETKNKTWYQGELDRYNYIQKVFDESKKAVEEHYFQEMLKRLDKRVKDNKLRTWRLTKKELLQLWYYFGRDINHLYLKTKSGYENKSFSKTLYFALKEIKGFNYSILGTNAVRYLSDESIPKEAKPYIAKYHWAMMERKNFLWNLESSKDIALNIKDNLILRGFSRETLSCKNKILLFSELTSQAEKLSKYSIHSNNGDTAKKIKENNKILLDKFNNSEINELSSVRSLQLGLNLKGATHAIFESYSGSSTNAKQAKGRLNRLEKDKLANVIIIRPLNNQMGDIWFNNAFGWIENYTIINNINEL